LNRIFTVARHLAGPGPPPKGGAKTAISIWAEQTEFGISYGWKLFRVRGTGGHPLTCQSLHFGGGGGEPPTGTKGQAIPGKLLFARGGGGTKREVPYGADKSVFTKPRPRGGALVREGLKQGGGPPRGRISRKRAQNGGKNRVA